MEQEQPTDNGVGVDKDDGEAAEKVEGGRLAVFHRFVIKYYVPRVVGLEPVRPFANAFYDATKKACIDGGIPLVNGAYDFKMVSVAKHLHSEALRNAMDKIDASRPAPLFNDLYRKELLEDLWTDDTKWARRLVEFQNDQYRLHRNRSKNIYALLIMAFALFGILFLRLGAEGVSWSSGALCVYSLARWLKSRATRKRRRWIWMILLCVCAWFFWLYRVD